MVADADLEILEMTARVVATKSVLSVPHVASKKESRACRIKAHAARTREVSEDARRLRGNAEKKAWRAVCSIMLVRKGAWKPHLFGGKIAAQCALVERMRAHSMAAFYEQHRGRPSHGRAQRAPNRCFERKERKRKKK